MNHNVKVINQLYLICLTTHLFTSIFLLKHLCSNFIVSIFCYSSDSCRKYFLKSLKPFRFLYYCTTPCTTLTFLSSQSIARLKMVNLALPFHINFAIFFLFNNYNISIIGLNSSYFLFYIFQFFKNLYSLKSTK